MSETASESPRVLTVQTDLRAAADHLERVGLNQDGGFFADQSVGPRSTRPCCALGALGIVTGEWTDATRTLLEPVSYEARERYGRAYLALREELIRSERGASIVMFSDTAPSAAAVAAAMRDAADHYNEVSG